MTGSVARAVWQSQGRIDQSRAGARSTASPPCSFPLPGPLPSPLKLEVGCLCPESHTSREMAPNAWSNKHRRRLFKALSLPVDSPLQMRSVVRSKSFFEHLHHSLSPCPAPSWGLSCRLWQPVDPPLKVICSCLSVNSQLAGGCSQWADRRGYSVFFLYLQLHRRYFLVPKNCLLALSQRAAVSISTI